jgi:adhesin transport system outer membrane protein
MLMSFIRKKWLRIAGGVSLAATMCANAVSAAESISLKSAVESAITAHPQVLSRVAEVDTADAAVEAANWGKYPTPTLETATGEGGLTAVLRVDQPVWNGGRISSEIDSAEFQKQAAQNAVDEARLDIELRVIEAYADALVNRSKLVHANAGVIRHKELFQMMERRVKQEINSRADLNLAESRLLQAQADVSSLNQSYETALTSLTELTGKSVDGVATVLIKPTALESLDLLLDQAEKFSPALKRLSMEIASAQKQIDVANSAILPQVVARFEHTNSADVTDNRVMLVLQAQPGAGLSALSNVRSAESLKRVLEQSRDATLREIRQRLRADHASYRSSQVLLTTARNASEISRQVFESYMRQFVTGRKTWIDVLNATREMTQATLSFEDVKGQSLLSKLRLLSITGQLSQSLSE